MKASGCPAPSISGVAGDGSSSRLESRILRRCRLADLRVAPSSVLRYRRRFVFQVAPDRESSGPSGVPPSSPGLSHLTVLPLVESPSCPESSSSGSPKGKFPSRPESKVLRRLPPVGSPGCPGFLSFGVAVAGFSGCPESASTAGSMMNPRLSSNFASPAYAADESSSPTGPASPALTLDALSISFGHPPPANRLRATRF